MGEFFFAGDATDACRAAEICEFIFAVCGCVDFVKCEDGADVGVTWICEEFSVGIGHHFEDERCHFGF